MIDPGKRKTRREFIKQSTIAAGVIPWLYAFGQSARFSGYPFDKNDLNSFKRKFSGQIILPGDDEYEAKRKARVFHPKTDKHPSIIANCINEQDVLRCIDFARHHQLEIAVRSGNHSNMGWGSCEVCRVLTDATAFELRKNGAVHLLSRMKWNDNKVTPGCMAWHNETFERLLAYSGKRIYSNYMSIDGGTNAKEVYGNNFSRLALLKKKYDPDNLFHLNQNILPG